MSSKKSFFNGGKSKFYPVYRGTYPELGDFDATAKFTVHLITKEKEPEELEFLLESGFLAVPDDKVQVDLSSYGFNSTYRRFFLYLDSARLKEITSASYTEFESIARSILNFQEKKRFKLFELEYSQEKPLIMGIINVTPDSFFSESRAQTVDKVLRKAEEMISEGASILDIGGQSTRPGSEEISLDEELKRVIPAVRAISERFDVYISVDTFRWEVAAEALEAGAKIINDIYGLRDEKMLELAVNSNVPVIAMHMKGTPADMQKNPYYDDCIFEIFAFFCEIVERYVQAGGDLQNLILDPGIGFGKRYEDNLTIVSQLEAFKSFGLPVLIGHSRKSFIGIALNNVSPEERLFGTVAAGSIAVYNGASILRVHDVKEAYDSALVAAELSKFKLNG